MLYDRKRSMIKNMITTPQMSTQHILFNAKYKLLLLYYSQQNIRKNNAILWVQWIMDPPVLNAKRQEIFLRVPL
jgi:hypothetical protein